MQRLLFLLGSLWFLWSACTVDTRARHGHTPGGEIGVAPACGSVTFRAAPAFLYQCPNERVDVSWSATPLSASCSRITFGTGCIAPPGGLGEICTDVWTDPTDLTSEPRLGDCSTARRAAGECIYCRYPASGSESVTPTSDVVVRYVAARTYGEGEISQCFTQREIRIIPDGGTRPHAQEFPWVCDAGGTGRWASVEWDPTAFASRSIRLSSVINTSSVPVDVLLRRRNAAGVEFIHNARNVAPGAPLPADFTGAAEGQWFVTPNPPDRFEPAACPLPPAPGSTLPARIPFAPVRVPPPLSMLFQLDCRTGG